MARARAREEHLERPAARPERPDDRLREELKGAPMNFFPLTLDEARMIADRPRRRPRLPLPRRPGRDGARRTA
jgi:hypothetical protein